MDGQNTTHEDIVSLVNPVTVYLRFPGEDSGHFATTDLLTGKVTDASGAGVTVTVRRWDKGPLAIGFSVTVPLHNLSGWVTFRAPDVSQEKAPR